MPQRLALAALPVWAQEATTEATETVTEAATEVVPVMDKGDVAWMMISTVLVLFMILPGVALFYGGLVRTKNMLSVLMQTTVITALVIVIWVFCGYSMAFGDAPSAYWGGLGKAFLSGVTIEIDGRDLHRRGMSFPEYMFIAFQMTFAASLPALIIGAFAERVKFSRADAVHRAVGDGRLLPDRAHGLGLGRPDLWLGRAGLCRRHGCAHQRRYRGAGRLPASSGRASATRRTTCRRTR